MRKIYVQLLLEASKAGHVNPVRYMLALRLLDERGAGWLSLDEALPKLADTFDVKEKTALNNLYKAENLGYGAFDHKNDRFYYKSQEAILQALGTPLGTTKAVYTRLQDIGGDIVNARAFFENSVLVFSETITRDKRTELSGRSRTTQLKYERVLKTQKNFNFAVLAVFDDYTFEMFVENGWPVFLYTDHQGVFGRKGTTYIMRQIANTYSVPTQGCRRRTRHKLTTRGTANVTVFFESQEEAEAYHEKNPETPVYFRENHTWGFISPEVPGN